MKIQELERKNGLERLSIRQILFLYEVQDGLVYSVSIHHSWDSVYWHTLVCADDYMAAMKKK